MLHWRTITYPIGTSVLSWPKQSKSVFMGPSELQEAEGKLFTLRRIVYFEKNVRDILAEGIAALTQSHTKREDLGMVSPKPRHPPTTHRNPRATRHQRKAEETFRTYTLFTTHTTKLSQWKGFKAVVKSSYSQMGDIQRNPSLWMVLLSSMGITHAATGSWFADGAWEGAPYHSETAVFWQWHCLGEQTAPRLPTTLCSACFSQRKGRGDLCQAAGALSQLLFGHLCGPGSCR